MYYKMKIARQYDNDVRNMSRINKIVTIENKKKKVNP